MARYIVKFKYFVQKEIFSQNYQNYFKKMKIGMKPNPGNSTDRLSGRVRHVCDAMDVFTLSPMF
jgi:hypothetical protein